MLNFFWQLHGELLVQRERMAKEVERGEKAEKVVDGEGEGEDGAEAEGDKIPQVY